jgi:uncharacterized repeat protein (TIGR03803 family)
MRPSKMSGLPCFLFLTISACLVSGNVVAQSGGRILYEFQPSPNCYSYFADFQSPLIADAEGNLYGSTFGGGAYDEGCIFELFHSENGWQEYALYSFDGADGDGPNAALVFDRRGNLYGTASRGGTYDGGVVFELSPSASGTWSEKVLHSFGNADDGTDPNSNLIFDEAGNLYGTTDGQDVGGTVFKLSPAREGWTETVLYTFPDSTTGPDGYQPAGGVVMDREGKLYGSTLSGGTYGDGAVYQLTPSDDGYKEQVIHSFTGRLGVTPNSGLTIDRDRNLYGTTSWGGNIDAFDCYSLYNSGCGVVFELTKDPDGDWKEKVLHAMTLSEGDVPMGPVVFDDAGDLYAAADAGGSEIPPGSIGQGTVFRLSPTPTGGWREMLIHNFNVPLNYGAYGEHPTGVIVNRGRVFGMAGGGVYDSGIVYEITPPPPFVDVNSAP